MYLWDNRLCKAVPVGIAGHDGFITPYEHIIHALCVNGQTLNASERLQCRINTVLHMEKKRLCVPSQAAIPLRYTIWKAVDLLCLQRPGFLLADDVPAGGCADVDGKITLHTASLLMSFCPNRAKAGFLGNGNVKLLHQSGCPDWNADWLECSGRSHR